MAQGEQQLRVPEGKLDINLVAIYTETNGLDNNHAELVRGGEGRGLRTPNPVVNMKEEMVKSFDKWRFNDISIYAVFALAIAAPKPRSKAGVSLKEAHGQTIYNTHYAPSFKLDSNVELLLV